MTFKKIVKSFAAGLLFPAIFLPLAYSALYVFGMHAIPKHPLQFIPMFIPLLFGITNILYVRVNSNATAINSNASLWLTGAILGFVVAVFAVYVLRLPTIVFGFKGGVEVLPLVILPVVYGAIFRYIVKWLNKALGV